MTQLYIDKIEIAFFSLSLRNFDVVFLCDSMHKQFVRINDGRILFSSTDQKKKKKKCLEHVTICPLQEDRVVIECVSLETV